MTLWKWDYKQMKDRAKNGHEIKFCDKMIKKEYDAREYIELRAADVVSDYELIKYLESELKIEK